MTVAELIEALQEMPQDMEVVIEVEYSGYATIRQVTLERDVVAITDCDDD